MYSSANNNKSRARARVSAIVVLYAEDNKRDGGEFILFREGLFGITFASLHVTYGRFY